MRGPLTTVGVVDCASSLVRWNGFLNTCGWRLPRQSLQAVAVPSVYLRSAGCWPFCTVFCTRSTLPLKFAFSSIDRRPAVRSPVSVEPWRSSTFARSAHIALQRTHHNNVSRRDIRCDLGILPDGQLAVVKRDGAFNYAIHYQIFAAIHLAADLD